MGYFGSRSGSGQAPPRRDDNASGSAVLLLADLVNRSYANLSDGDEARSVLFMCFDAESRASTGRALRQ